MKKYSKDEIETFLLAIDGHLQKRFDLIIIGGTAAALAYHVTSFTKDIDTVGAIDAIQKAYEAAMKDTGLQIPMGPAAVWDGPYEYETRLVPYPLAGTRCLRVFVPERHDLVLMKAIRAQQNDLDTAKDMHLKEPLKFDLLIQRIKTEMTQVTGEKRNIKLNFLVMFEELFSEAKAKEAATLLKGWESS